MSCINYLNQIVKLSKAEHYEKIFKGKKNKLNNVWKGVKDILNISERCTQQIRKTDNSGMLIIEKNPRKLQIHVTIFSGISHNKLKKILYLHKKNFQWVPKESYGTVFLNSIWIVMKKLLRRSKHWKTTKPIDLLVFQTIS